jgi:curved DNA-binding protein CbpA
MNVVDSGREQAKHSAREPNLESSDPYAVLGLTRDASAGEVRRAYFNLVREYTPEAHPEAFKQVRGAYEKLRKADVREETDLFLFQPPYPWEPRGRRGSLDLEVHSEDVWTLLQHHGDLGRVDFQRDYRSI